MNPSAIFPRAGLATVAVALAAATILAGCGGGDSNDSGSSSTASTDQGSSTAKTSYGYGSQSSSSEGTQSAQTSQGAAGTATVTTSTQAGLGPILVDANGMTLYMFEKDKNGKSSCDGACAAAWPPLTTQGSPAAKSGVKQGKLGTTARSDGSTQVTYAGWPLYLYAGDTQPGQANGNDIDQFGAEWYAVTPAGDHP